MAPLFSIVICTYERYDRLPFAIESVLAQDMAPELYDVWAIDNSPPSPAREASRARWASNPRVHYVTLDTPGLSNARNVAAGKAQAAWLVFLDDDAIAAPGWLEGYRAAIETLGEGAVFLGGRIEPDFELPRPPWLHDSLLMFLSVLDAGEDMKEMPQDLAPVGANMAVRRDLLLAAGGFDAKLGRTGAETRNLMSGEETALIARFRAEGRKFHYVPDARVKHCVPASRLTRAWFRRRVAWQMISGLGGFHPSLEQKNAMWADLLNYLKQIPREHVPYMGLFWDTDDPVLFCKQIQCVQYATHFLLAQGCYPKDAGA